MTEGAAWRPIRHMNLNVIGARVQFRRPTVDGHLTLAGPFVVRTLYVDPGLTLGGEPMFEMVRITDTNGDPFTAYDGDEFQEIHP